MVKWKELVGKRVLILDYKTWDLLEAKVVEVSPSGKFVKLMYPNGTTVWKSTSSIYLEEVLSS